MWCPRHRGRRGVTRTLFDVCSAAVTVAVLTLRKGSGCGPISAGQLRFVSSRCDHYMLKHHHINDASFDTLTIEKGNLALEVLYVHILYVQDAVTYSNRPIQLATWCMATTPLTTDPPRTFDWQGFWSPILRRPAGTRARARVETGAHPCVRLTTSFLPSFSTHLILSA